MPAPPTFATPAGFLGVSRSHRDAAFVVAGIPLDIGTTNRAGARDGPQAIRRASRMLVDGDHPEFWVEPAMLDLADIGDLHLALGDIPESLRLIEQQAAGLRHLVALGGEHGITLPLLRALAQRLGHALALVHFDAHVDTWPANFGQRLRTARYSITQSRRDWSIRGAWCRSASARPCTARSGTGPSKRACGFPPRNRCM